MKTKRLFIVALSLVSLFSCKKQDDTRTEVKSYLESDTSTVDSKFEIYLCFGQSNMEGSATIEDVDKTVDPRFQMMPTYDCSDLGRKAGEWYDAVPPLSQCYAGLSPADYFGRTMVKSLNNDIRIGVISVAVGGCDIRLFDKDIYQDYTETYAEKWFTDKVANYGGSPYQALVNHAKIAQKDGVIKGILLHQGETNNQDTQWPEYVKRVYDNLLKDLDLKASEVPLLAGEVVHEDMDGGCAAMNPIINTLPELIPTAHVVSSSKCEVRDDFIHFNSAGVRELGRRYAEKMLFVQGR